MCHAIRYNFLGNGVSKTIGSAFEERALEYLQRQRLRFVTRNFVCRGGEIDLVMREIGSAHTLVFVEVRARRSRQFAAAAASIGAHKQRRLVLAAQHYLMTWRGALPACRFDVIAFDAGRIVWLRDAFRADN
ncbi:YraN family protein [Caballeronia sordidicola]|uniref:YraN family protein n=1 Tax=Caballeronia sordidicola TaxID=196367 RepID=UPI00211A9610|nr:YraN family protein [Caballeronia sordidicola]